ncbi:hypothetical protein KKF84_15675 [Myxococcota bacterium]|nr:hypothetical protein [Myxococcota bacterium]MBU1536764.1 hypothetical protein [Myxococcota bacterium]
MQPNENYTICPVCFKDREFELEGESGPHVKHLYTTDAGFNGPGKNRSIKDNYFFNAEGAPSFWVHLFPLCKECCGTGVVLSDDDFKQLQMEVSMMTDNLQSIIHSFKDHSDVLREHAERLTLVLLPLIVRRSLRLVRRPAKHSYARYLANLFDLEM